jgi:acid stress chaperone HdeA
MNRTLIGSFFLAVAVALPAWAQAPTTNPMKMKCEDFVAVGDAYRPAMVYYVAGVDKLGVGGTDTMVEDTATPIAMVVAECQKTPKASFPAKVRQMLKSKQLVLFEHH